MTQKKQVAKIIESTCIGCTKCIQVCPFDAIIGANKQMHVVLTEHCTGCELCLPPCPMSCIELVPSTEDKNASSAKLRVKARKERLIKSEKEKAQADSQALKVNISNAIADSLARVAQKKKAFNWIADE